MRVLIQQGKGELGKRVSLDEQEAHHLKVRRAREGEVVEVLDGSGFLGAGTLVQAGRSWAVDISAAQVAAQPAELTLAVAAGDRERFEWMLEKAVELGVTRVVPLQSARTAGVTTRLRDSHVARFQRSVLESIKQCGVAWAPTIETPVPLATFLEQPPSGTGWLADQHGDPPPSLLESSPLTVIVGPEGGLTDDEREETVRAGYRPIALGLHTLRFETAALAAAAAIAQARMRGQHG
jgi:16S rRNA (uracil1498-N3)-methyltransferase